MKKILLSMFAFALAFNLAAQCTDLFFSEYVEGSHNNKSLEIYNPTAQPIVLDNYQMSRYSNGETVPNYVSFPAGTTIQPYDVLVVTLDKQNCSLTGQDTCVFESLRALTDVYLCPVYNENKMMYFNGNDAVSLEKKTGQIVDLIGKVGEDPGTGWNEFEYTDPETGETYTNYWTEDVTIVRKPTVKQGVTTNPSEFIAETEWIYFNRNNFSNLQSHTCDCAPNTVIEFSAKHEAFFFPNPVTDNTFTVKATGFIASVEVSNVIGQTVYNEKNPQHRGDMIVNLKNCKNGMYLVKINFEDNKSIVRKILVK